MNHCSWSTSVGKGIGTFVGAGVGASVGSWVAVDVGDSVGKMIVGGVEGGVGDGVGNSVGGGVGGDVQELEIASLSTASGKVSERASVVTLAMAMGRVPSTGNRARFSTSSR